MKLSINDPDAIYYEVYLDGNLVRGATFADEETGTVEGFEVVETPRRGVWKQKILSDGQSITFRKTGKVELRRVVHGQSPTVPAPITGRKPCRGCGKR